MKKMFFAFALMLCLSAGALGEETPAVRLILPQTPAPQSTPVPEPTATPEQPAASPSADPLTLQTAKEANLRKLPDIKSDLLERVKAGSRVEVISQSELEGETWAYVRIGKSRREGYMLMELLEPIPTPTPVPTATPAPTPTLVPGTLQGEVTYDEPRLARTKVRSNLRKRPDGGKIGELKANALMSVQGEIESGGELWLHITAEKTGESGYILASLTRQIQPAVLEPVSEAEVREKFPVLSFDPIADIKAIIPFTYTEEELSAYGTLRVGDRSNAVLALRKRLYELGYYAKPNENALYTESTAEIVGLFQRDCGLPVTGEADPHTQAMLFDPRTLAREGSAQEITYLSNKANAPLYIQRAEVTSFSFYGSIQLSLENRSGGKLTRFGLKIIPYMTDGTPADMKETFAEEIEREYVVDDIAIGRGDTYSDFATNDKDEEFGIWPHHFQVSRKIYFTGAQLAVSWYRSGGKNVYVDDDQLIFVEAGAGAGESYMHTLPITISDTERAEAAKWEMGIVSRYVLPVYQEYYGLPQGAWLKTVEEGSPAQDAGLEPEDIIVGVGDITILGDATLRKARASVAAGESATVYFWRDGQYYTTEMLRPAE
ncbi:MAG: peptidoglycan-binding protein [Clostridia bacterium]|nr:peptidoglycan-binding protein [Clostridia bacterium]